MPALHKKNRALKQILRNKFHAPEREPVKQEAAAANAPAYTLSTDIPETYNDTYIRAIPQDPQTTFVYWEITSSAGKAYMGNDEAAKIQETLPVRVSHNTGNNAGDNNNNAHDGNRWWQNNNQWNDDNRWHDNNHRHDNHHSHDNNNRWHDDGSHHHHHHHHGNNDHHGHGDHSHQHHNGHHGHNDSHGHYRHHDHHGHQHHAVRHDGDTAQNPAALIATPFEITLNILIRKNTEHEQQRQHRHEPPEAALCSAMLYKTGVEKAS